MINGTGGMQARSAEVLAAIDMMIDDVSTRYEKEALRYFDLPIWRFIARHRSRFLLEDYRMLWHFLKQRRDVVMIDQIRREQ